jgi:hypothetical protein
MMVVPFDGFGMKFSAVNAFRAPSACVASFVGAGRRRRTAQQGDAPMAADMTAENRKPAFKKHGIGADSVQDGEQFCHQETPRL